MVLSMAYQGTVLCEGDRTKIAAEHASQLLSFLPYSVVYKNFTMLSYSVPFGRYEIISRLDVVLAMSRFCGMQFHQHCLNPVITARFACLWGMGTALFAQFA